jgi:glutamate-5-semialdehyde dehydrogenase
MALAIVHNSKVPRPLACNAAETVLVNRNWAGENLSGLLQMLRENGIGIRGSSEVCELFPDAQPAAEEDWEREFFAPTIAVKLVEDVVEAVAHINRYRTPHTECIITEHEANARYFQSFVEANVVCWNASTRLTDGMEFGMGGEMGISTQKYPVSGPIGIRHLMQQKYYLTGNGALR